MRFNRLEILLNILFWVFFTWLIAFSNTTMDIVDFEIIDEKKEKILARNYTRVYTFLILQFFTIIFIYIELYLIHLLKRPKAIRSFIFKSILLLFGIFVVQAITIFLVYYYRGEINTLENFDDFNILGIMTIFYMAVVICYGFTKKWIQHEREKQHLELIKNQAELNLLKQQLQPHFLFNTMNNLLAMVNQTDNPRLAQSIDKLSNLLRYVVYDTQNEKVIVSQEISFIKNFAELHLLRFEDEEIDFKIETSGNFDTQPIESGIFLCYIENAFKHGVQPEETAFINVTIDMSKNNIIIFTIENSIPKAPFKNDSWGFGLKSNQERLDLAYSGKHLIVFEKEKTYKVELTIYTDG